MSDTEEAPTPVKAKRTMTPEARERMLANLAKGREAKLKKAAERRQSKSDQSGGVMSDEEMETAPTSVDFDKRVADVVTGG